MTRVAKKNNGGDSRLEGVPKKWAKVLEQDLDFVEKAQQASVEDLDKMIVESSELIVNFTKDMEADQDLLDKKAEVKEAAATYTEGIKVNKARQLYCVMLKRVVD